MKDWIDSFNKYTALFAAYLFFSIGLIIAYEVVARYLFNMPTIWVEEVSRVLQLWGCYLSMGWMLKQRKMIRINVLLQRLSARPAKLAELLTIVIIGVFSVITIYYASIITLDSIAIDRHTSSMLGLPAWLFDASIVVGFVLLLVQCLVEFIRTCQQQSFNFDTEHDI
ncbi:MAG: TRAP transporter small permease [Oceanospirillaceae bacterium]|nr:TRAP transporter small permease [Oceanospirillaceae bacterium]